MTVIRGALQWETLLSQSWTETHTAQQAELCKKHMDLAVWDRKWMKKTASWTEKLTDKGTVNEHNEFCPNTHRANNFRFYCTFNFLGSLQAERPALQSPSADEDGFSRGGRTIIVLMKRWPLWTDPLHCIWCAHGTVCVYVRQNEMQPVAPFSLAIGSEHFAPESNSPK